MNQAPAFSPDGKKLALTLSTRDGNLDVYVLDLTTNGLTRITDDPGIDTEPQWSKRRPEPVFHVGSRGRPADLPRRDSIPAIIPAALTFQGNYNARPRLSPG